MSSPHPPIELVAVAAVLHEQAERLLAISARILVVAATTRWQSPAARTFRTRVSDHAQALRTSAARLLDLADVLSRHVAQAASASEAAR